MSILDIFRRSRKQPPPEVISLTPDNFKYIWNHQLIVIQNDITIDLIHPMFPISPDLKKYSSEYKKLFPFVVGNNGNLIGTSFARCIFNRNEPQKNSVHLDYVLDKKLKTKLVLKVSGNDPQTVEVIKDERKANATPVILFLAKSVSSN